MSAQSPKLDQWTSGEAYDIWMGRWSALLAAEFLSWLRLPANQRALDVCCGSGILSLAIAQRYSPEHVAAFDRSPAQIAFASEHRAHPRVTYSVADAMALPLPADSFEVTVCGLGLNFVPDPARALDEFRRITRPGGTVACFVWDYSEGARFIRAFWDAALEIEPESAKFDQARRFEICKPDVLEKSFAAAHFGSFELHPLDIRTRFENFDDYWKPFQLGQGSAPVYLRSRPTQIQNVIRGRLMATLPAAPDGSITLPAPCLGHPRSAPVTTRSPASH
jgi:SAM-dependent methyltransferase